MERRKFPRIPYGAWVEDLTREDGIQFYLAKNLSMGGILLLAAQPPAIGNRLHLRLVVENEPRIMSIDGKVIRHMDSDKGLKAFAVQFTDMDPPRQVFIEDLINECGVEPEYEALDDVGSEGS